MFLFVIKIYVYYKCWRQVFHPILSVKLVMTEDLVMPSLKHLNIYISSKGVVIFNAGY